MKIYFTASITGLKDYRESYRLIADSLKELGYKVYADHVVKANTDQVKTQTHEDKIKIYQSLSKMLRSCDIVVADVSFPSISVGHEISLALAMNKPVIALCQGTKLPALLEGNTSDKLLMQLYDPKKLKPVLKKLMAKAEAQLDIRFNFFITPLLLHYLEWISSTRRIPRSVYIRELIEKDLRLHQDYVSEFLDQTG